MAKVALITGASSGIRYATASELKERDSTVYGAVRHVEKIPGFLTRESKPFPWML